MSNLPSFILRPFADTDHAQWQTLWQAYLAYAGTTLSADVSRLTWQRLLTHPAMHGLGAYDPAGNMLAFAHIILHPNTWNIGECAYLEDLFVSETARKQGIARALLNAVYDLAKQQHCNRVYWVTAADNHQAQALYRQLARDSGVIQFRHDLPASS